MILCLWYSRLFWVHHRKTWTVVHNPRIRIYLNKIESRFTFKTKIGYYLEILTPQTMKLFENTKICIHLFQMIFSKTFNSGWFHINEVQPCHPYSQILIKFCSNIPTYKKQKWAKFFHLTLNVSWDIGFWNLGNFRAFFSEIRHFQFSVSNEIVISWVL